MLGVDVAGQLTIVVGGGRVATRKVETLLGAGARLRVISPAISPELTRLETEGRVSVSLRPFEPGDTAGALLVVAATGIAIVDEAVAAEVVQRGGLVSVSGAPHRGNIHFTAQVNRGPITVGIATGGGAPAVAKRLRRELDAQISPAYGRLAEELAAVREALTGAARLTQLDRAAIYTELVEGPLLELLAAGREDEVRALITEILHRGMFP
jgi:precorrin-2 dehydrogenase/sirohydrochlorin ferrochelatase